MKIKDILIFVQGMTPELGPINVEQDVFLPFQRKLADAFAHLKLPEGQKATFEERFGNNVIYVQWGHTVVKNQQALREDEKLTPAQATVWNRTRYAGLEPAPQEQKVLDIPGLLPFARDLKEAVILRGLGDVVYYCSDYGETQVRSVVYSQLIAALKAHGAEGDVVRMHVIGHSLGVTVAHDFLFGLFNRDPFYVPWGKQHIPDHWDDFHILRDRVADKRLMLGSFISLASQLPLLCMRGRTCSNPKNPPLQMIDILCKGQGGASDPIDSYFDPADIGLLPDSSMQDQTRWLILYSTEDMLGFPTRPLYRPDAAQALIVEKQVNTGLFPGAHTGYWRNPTVVNDTAKLLEKNSRVAATKRLTLPLVKAGQQE